MGSGQGLQMTGGQPTANLMNWAVRGQGGAARRDWGCGWAPSRPWTLPIPPDSPDWSLYPIV